MPGQSKKENTERHKKKSRSFKTPGADLKSENAIQMTNLSQAFNQSLPDEALWTQSLWDMDIQSTIDQMDPEAKFRYQKMGEILFNKVDNPTIETSQIESAAQIYLMLRDGLSPEMLTAEEKNVFVQTYGEEKLKEFQDLN